MTVSQRSTLQLAPAEPGNALALAALELQRARENGRPAEPGFLDRYADFWLAQRATRPAWIATSPDGTALGSIVLDVRFRLPSPGMRPRADALVETLFVTVDARGTGVDEKLLRAALFWCSQNDIRSLRAEDDHGASELLARLGFVDVSPHVVEVRMR